MKSTRGRAKVGVLVLAIFFAFSAQAKIVGRALSLCDVGEEELKAQLLQSSMEARDVCAEGVTPEHTGGFTCTKASVKGCKKFRFRCVTQFLCSLTPAPVSGHKREFTEDGIVYVEEKTDDKNGITATSIMPKAGQEKTTLTSKTQPNGATTVTATTTGPGVKATVASVRTQETETELTKVEVDLYAAFDAGCKPFEASFEDPMIQGTVKSTIHGRVDGKCKFSQAMPGVGTYMCLFGDVEMAELKSKKAAAMQDYSQNPKICNLVSAPPEASAAPNPPR